MNKKYVYEIYRTAGLLKADCLWQESGWKDIRFLSIVNYMEHVLNIPGGKGAAYL
jgi:hypothetical protein